MIFEKNKLNNSRVISFFVARGSPLIKLVNGGLMAFKQM